MRFPALFLFLLVSASRAGAELPGEVQTEQAEGPRVPLVAIPVQDEEPPEGLADIEGLPQVPSAPASVADEIRAAPGGDEAGCKDKVPAPLRAMVFRHYQNFQEMQNRQGVFFPEKAAVRASQLLGMVPKESAGDSTNVTDMTGKEVGTYQAQTTLDRWNTLFKHDKIKYNKQTNWGLAQMSMDRLVVGFKVDTKLDDFLPGDDTSATSAQNVRRLLDFYQDFAQGRLEQHDRPITEKELADPKAPPAMKERARKGLQKALWHCGTRFLFKEGQQGEAGAKALEQAMASIAYCDAGQAKPDLNSDAQMKCFARWVTLCPALNLDIAILTPDSYFATRHAAPLCQATFRKLTKKPGS